MPNRIKDRIKELERTHRLITENRVDAVWPIDPASLTFEVITPSPSRISGYGADEPSDTSILERRTPGSARSAKIFIAPNLKTGLDPPASLLPKTRVIAYGIEYGKPLSRAWPALTAKAAKSQSYEIL